MNRDLDSPKQVFSTSRFIWPLLGPFIGWIMFLISIYSKGYGFESGMIGYVLLAWTWIAACFVVLRLHDLYRVIKHRTLKESRDGIFALTVGIAMICATVVLPFLGPLLSPTRRDPSEVELPAIIICRQRSSACELDKKDARTCRQEFAECVNTERKK